MPMAIINLILSEKLIRKIVNSKENEIKYNTSIVINGEIDQINMSIIMAKNKIWKALKISDLISLPFSWANLNETPLKKINIGAAEENNNLNNLGQYSNG